jgi:hypothetical protein
VKLIGKLPIDAMERLFSENKFIVQSFKKTKQEISGLKSKILKVKSKTLFNIFIVIKQNDSETNGRNLILGNCRIKNTRKKDFDKILTEFHSLVCYMNNKFKYLENNLSSITSNKLLYYLMLILKFILIAVYFAV